MTGLRSLGQLRQSHTRRGMAAWYGQCPVCGDRCPTHLRVWKDETGRLHPQCYGGRCRQVSYRVWWAEFLSVTGTTGADWGVGKERREVKKVQIVAAYDYQDARGRLLFQAVKFAPGGRQKMAYRRPAYDHDDPAKVKTDAKGRRWVWDGQGFDQDKLELGEIVPADPVLYRLPELLAADPRRAVVFCEGEPDVEVARALGLLATCNPHGAQNASAGMVASLAGRRVVVCEDNDEAGRRHAATVAGMLVTGGAAGVRVVRFTHLEEHGDLADFVAAAAARYHAVVPTGSVALAAWLAGLDDDGVKPIRREVTNYFGAAPEWVVATRREA